MSEKPICKVNIEELVLIVKSKNRPGIPVFREDLPTVLFNRAPRILLGSKWFNKYSSSNKSTHCECCLSQGTLERHEVYGLYKWRDNYIIKLEYIIKLCSKCHKKIHGGFSSRLGLKYGFIPELAPMSDSMDSNKYPWNKAKYILIEDSLYLL